MPFPTYTNFVPPAIDAGNLNEINGVVYGLLGNGTDVPTNDLDIRNNIGLGNVDNTSDINKPVSTAQQAAIDLVPGRLIGIQTFTANGTYTPTAGTTSIVSHVIGGGGAGGGAATTPAAAISSGAGGGSGSYSIGRFTSGFSGAAVTVGAGGVGVSGAAGGNGGQSSLGALITAPGGAGGPVVPANAVLRSGAGVGGVVGTGGNILQAPGSAGDHILQVQPNALGTAGGEGPFGGKVSVVALANGQSASTAAYGTGGGGGSNDPSSGVARTGGNGAPGVVIIYEYS